MRVGEGREEEVKVGDSHVTRTEGGRGTKYRPKEGVRVNDRQKEEERVSER